MAKQKAKIRIDCAYDKLVAVAELKPNPANPNIHSAEQVEKLARLIGAHGWRHPITVSNRSGYIVAGHCRLKAAEQIGAVEVPVDYQDFTSDAEEKAVLVADNIIAELAETDYQMMGDVLKGLKKLDYDLDLTALSAEQINDYLYGQVEPVEGEDEVPELPKKARTKRGDLIQMGQHRLLCGDSTTAADVGRLMGKHKADMVFTDPPYGAKITDFMYDVHAGKNKKHWNMIEGDQFENEELQQFLEKAFKQFSKYSKNNAAWYIWHAMLTQGFFSAAAAAALILNRQIIWVKPCLILAYGDYHWRHELCFYGWKKNHKPKFYGPKNENTVWEIDFDGKGRMPKEERKSPTQKPVALAERAIKNSSKQKEIVLDGFLGSGSTLIACEKLDRRCFGMEIDPLYCDVIVERWQKFTDKKAKRIQSKRRKSGV